MKNKSKFGLIIAEIVIAILISGCGQTKCGDGICDFPAENCYICKRDCLDPNDICCKPNSPDDGRCANFDCAGDTNCPDVHPQLIRSGRFPKWSHSKNLIVFDEFIDGNYEILTMESDGSDVKCLTCNQLNLPRRHKGQPNWDPSGEYIVFTAENDEYKRRHFGRDMTVVPGISGRNNDVWIMTSDGEKSWRITNTPENGGVIRPGFSHDGKILYWNEEYSIEKHGKPSKWSVPRNRLGEKWGLWRIVMVDISFDQGEPCVTNIRKVDINELYPNKVLIESQGIQPDNEHLVFAAADISETAACCYFGGRNVFGYTHWSDIYITDLDGANLKRLTNTLYLHSENPVFSPDGKKIAFTETRWCVGKSGDVYLMNSDGSNRIRLTHLYNQNCPDDYLGRYSGSAGDELDWSPDGSEIIFSAIVGDHIKYPYVDYSIYILDIEEFIQG